MLKLRALNDVRRKGAERRLVLESEGITMPSAKFVVKTNYSHAALKVRLTVIP